MSGASGVAAPQQAALRSGVAAAAVRWNGLAIAGRQVFLFASSIVLARVLGPETYGVISAATIYVTFTTLLLDQGLAAAIIQRPVLSPRAAGAVASANIASGVVLAGLTWVAAPWVAEFFAVDALTPVLRMLGIGLVVKSLAISPRAMQARKLTFRSIAVADIAGAGLGSIAGITGALLGAGAASIVAQVVVLDLVAAVLLLRVERGPVPNRAVGELRELLPFGLRVMTTNGIAYFSRNIDNILVGRVLGIVALSYYGMAYRVLVIPVQMIGQTVSRVMFPVFSRIADRREQLGANLITATEMLSLATVPLMGLLAVASPDVVQVVLGTEWLPAAPLLTVLAVAGARETVLYLTGPLIKATGRVSLLVRYELLATAVQVSGIVAGLYWGVLGVAVGYTAAGFALTPVLLYLQRRLAGVTGRQQAGAMLPPVHGTLWAVVAYLLVSRVGGGPLMTLLLGTVAFAGAATLVMATVHRAWAGKALGRLIRLLPSRREGRGRTDPASTDPAQDPQEQGDEMGTGESFVERTTAGAESSGSSSSVTIAVLTYRRPEDLAEALPLLVAQLPDGIAGEVMVIDNDPDGGAVGMVAAIGDGRIKYVHEPRPGISAARNRALVESTADVLVFIDDDERPGDAWLDAMLAVHRSEGCAAVAGPVVSAYAIEPEPWILAGGFFDRRRPPTGTVVEAAATNNLLLDMAVVRRLGLRFDERFGLSGGSDTLFTRQLTRAGERIVWCAEATVVDAVPATRLTRQWVLRKALRSGNSWSRTSLEMADSAAERAALRVRLASRGLIRVAGGAARLLLGTVSRNRVHRARGARTLARGVGLTSGALGYVYSEYRRTTSS